MDTSPNFFSDKGRCEVRILIVADGIIHFRPAVNGFSLAELLKALSKSQRPWERFSITKARRDDEDDDKCCDLKRFRFDESSLNIQKFDQVWLFGWVGEDTPNSFLSDEELRAIYQFMNDGGGVFATGDHEGIGYAMCGRVPRVASMRKWQYKTISGPLKAPGRDDATRNDTLREGFDSSFQLTDQADSTAQEIRPKFFATIGGIGSHPHPVLADRKFAITVLPDHQHEGECVIPDDLTKTFQFAGGEPFDEFPRLPRSNARLVPDAVAIATSAGGFLLNEIFQPVPPVDPRCFLAIVAYDGQLVDRAKPTGETVHLGRVVVDSSFHHFLDINLNGTGTGKKKGFFDDQGHATKELKSFGKYYRNIVTWLLPAERRLQYCLLLLLHLRFSGPLIEELAGRSELSLGDVIVAGNLTRKAITEMYSAGEALSWAATLLKVLGTDVGFEVERLINPWLPHNLRPSKWALFINSEVIVSLTLGLAMLTVARETPSHNLQDLEKFDGGEAWFGHISASFSEVASDKFGKLSELLTQSRSAWDNS